MFFLVWCLMSLFSVAMECDQISESPRGGIHPQDCLIIRNECGCPIEVETKDKESKIKNWDAKIFSRVSRVIIREKKPLYKRLLQRGKKYPIIYKSETDWGHLTVERDKINNLTIRLHTNVEYYGE